ncbi:MAG: hypothetical protein HOJ34_01365 [Kordiimonadaceae bacterium]|nr:hypothetical protein [Kordiimonadaceae bacterium]MBT6036599.1 hypothetical protein [Kordiimonadaceae bacterium]MBT6328405.1 hypothetical protein [Kordiimonadaceae bacterium]MBT7583654.1 hypothetical protein [Kordiimonadaceae bacterium]
MKNILIASLSIFLIGCSAENTDNTVQPEVTEATPLFADAPQGVQAISLLGAELRSPAPSQKVLDNLADAKANYDADPMDIENIIWYGRRVAYTGDFRQAIEIYSEGLTKHPESSRLYRHRGHRYISIREFDRAVADYEMAAKLIEGEEDTIEQDGAPGPTGVPVSSRHTNIWYHLGLSYYLVHDWENSLKAYQIGHDLGLNDDNIVSTAHWIYMLHNRMGNPEKAKEAIAHITADMDVIENFSYHNLVLFYKGEIPPEEMLNVDPNDPSGAAVAYGVANWYLYNDQPEKAYDLMERFVATKSWASFGFIAAEAELNLR